jgi:hypothetical protein
MLLLLLLLPVQSSASPPSAKSASLSVELVSSSLRLSCVL